MDSISQFVLGASVAEAFWGKRIGNKALLWGGLLGTLPDLDVIPGYYMEDLARVEFHRGPSHSIFLFALISYPIAVSIIKLHKDKGMTLFNGIIGVFTILFTHALLDMCTTWGTKILWPFSTEAYAWQIVFVVDPLYTLPFLIALCMLMWFNRQNKWRWRLNIAALILSTTYLGWCTIAKNVIIDEIEPELASYNESILKINTRPAPLNSFLWATTVETKQAYYCYYTSLFDTNIQKPSVFKKDLKSREQWKNRKDFQQLLRITQGQIRIQKKEKGIEVADLRFGQTGGWSDNKSDFVFRYFLEEKLDNNREISYALPRPQTDNKKALKALWHRIWGI